MDPSPLRAPLIVLFFLLLLVGVGLYVLPGLGGSLGTEPVGTPGPTSEMLDEPASESTVVTIAVGEGVPVGDIGRINLVEIVTDSRCPEDAQCFWVGELVARVQYLEANHADAENVALGESVILGIEASSADAYEVTLLEAVPAPRSDGQIAVDEYELTFDIEVASNQ